MPPVRDHLSAEDPRAIAIATNNNANPDWDGYRPQDHTGDELDIPRALRAKGYESVAELVGAWTGKHVDTGTVRSWWRFDMADEASRYLPPPDVIIKRKGGLLLPGWADQTIREWLPAWVPKCNMKTYLEWDSTHDEVDPRVIALIAGNTERMVQTHLRRRYDDIPAAYLALGYEPAARAIGVAQGGTVSENTICKAWRDDLRRVNDAGESDPYSRYMPMPDALIARGTRAELLPGWSRATIEAWVPTRPGSGNHTRGDARRGRGSKQWWSARESEVAPA